AVLPAGISPGDELLDVLRAEINVKTVQFLQSADALVELSAQPNFRALGQRFGARTAQAAERIRALSTDVLRAFQSGEPLVMELDGETHELSPEDFTIVEAARGDLVVESDGGTTAALDPTVDAELRLEGMARELVNRIQRLRREAGLEVSDRIRLGVAGDEAIVEAGRRHRDFIARETLAVEFEVGSEIDAAGYTAMRELEIDGLGARIALAVARTTE